MGRMYTWGIPLAAIRSTVAFLSVGRSNGMAMR